MSDAPFDPYYMWLGIPPEDQPPNLYRLLGIAVFEQNFDVIESAAQRQISHLRTYATSPNSELSQELLNEVAVARVTLLNPARKAEYDQALTQSQAGRENVHESSQPASSQVPVPSFSPSITPAQLTSRKKKTSWNNPLLVSGFLVVSVVFSIALLKALQEDTEVVQVPPRPAIESQYPTTKKPRVNQQQATPSGIRPRNVMSQKQLSELLIKNRWQLDYFNPSLNFRRQATWQFSQAGQVTGDPFVKSWRIENDTLVTLPDGRNWKYDQELQRWEAVGKPKVAAYITIDLKSPDNAESKRANDQLSQRQIEELLVNNCW